MWFGEKLTEKFKNKRSMCEREVNGKMITEVLLQKSHVTEKERQELGENHVHIWQLKLLPSMIPYGQKGERKSMGLGSKSSREKLLNVGGREERW